MKEVTFITGNQNKAVKLAEYLDFPIKHQKLELDEIQSLDVKKIVEHKVKQAYDILKAPVLVEDVSLEFEALGGLPGPFIKFFIENIPYQDICSLLDNKDRKAKALAVYGYYDGVDLKIIEGGLNGSIAETPGGTNGWEWDQFFIPEGYDVARAYLNDEDYQKTYLQIKPIEKLKNFLENQN